MFDPTVWQQSLAGSFRDIDPTVWVQNVAASLRDIDPTVWQQSLAGSLRDIDPTVWQQSLARSLQNIDGPAWEQIVFRALHEFDPGEVDAESSTWWLELSLRIRTTVVASIVWTYVFMLLSTLSLEHQADAAVLRDSTGLDPAELAGGAAVLVGMAYRHFARPDDF